jgi:2-polyprenyl-3-methyl-5-hydroxy-6-metoxy-1,4-benzoquinol methylase
VAISYAQVIQSLPAPFNKENFKEYQQGIYEDAEKCVFLNQAEDFAFLYPQPSFNYSSYKPRFQSLNLGEYRKRNQVIEKRFEKVQSHFDGALDVLEIGSFDGAFLNLAKENNSKLRVASLEVDANTAEERIKLDGLKQYASFSELMTQQRRFDLVCFFHVLEHIADPAVFLASCSNILKENGKIIIEVPSLDDPLRKLYQIKEYEQFYFQAQHPYVYSAKSLSRLLQKNGFHVLACLGHQRYGLENHLTWLAKRRPGGDEILQAMFLPIDEQYRERLESSGHTDAAIAIAEIGHG